VLEVLKGSEKSMNKFIFFEGLCNLVLYQDEVFRRNWEWQDYEPLRDEDVEKYCGDSLVQSKVIEI